MVGQEAASAPVERAGDALDRHIRRRTGHRRLPTASMCTTLVASSGPWKRLSKRTWPICAPSPASSAILRRALHLETALACRCMRARSVVVGRAVCTSRMRSGDGLGCALDPRVRPTEDRMRILLARHGETPWNAERPLPRARRTSHCRRPARRRRVRWANACARAHRPPPWPRRWRARRTAELALGEARADARVRPGTDGRARRVGRPARQRDPRTRRRRLRVWRGRRTVQMPGGESLSQVLERVMAGVRTRHGRARHGRHAAGRRPRCGEPRAAVPPARHPAVAAVELPPGAGHAQPARRRGRRSPRRGAPQRRRAPHPRCSAKRCTAL